MRRTASKTHTTCGWSCSGSSRQASTRSGKSCQVRRRTNLLLFALGIIVAALAAGSGVYLHFRNQPRRVIQTAINLPDHARFDFDQGPVALSPDGTRLAFIATSGANTLLWVRPLDGSAAQPLAGTEGASYPFWSADSRFIGFFSEGKVKKIDATGGTAQVIADAPLGRGAERGIVTA